MFRASDEDKARLTRRALAGVIGTTPDKVTGYVVIVADPDQDAEVIHNACCDAHLLMVLADTMSAITAGMGHDLR